MAKAKGSRQRRSWWSRAGAALAKAVRGLWRLLRLRIVWIPLLACVAAFAVYLVDLDHLVTSRFDGRRWNLPAHVYARPLELYAGLPLSADGLAAELKRLGYRNVAVADKPGSSHRQGARIDPNEIQARPHATALIDGDRWFLRTGDREELYDLRTDPQQRTNLVATTPDIAVIRAAAARDDVRVETPRLESDDALRAQLEALGYAR